MAVKLYQCSIKLDANTLLFSLLAESDDGAMQLVRGKLDKDTRAELDSGEVSYELQEYSLESCVISMETFVNIG